MSVSDKVSTTMLWVKQLSSGTIISISRRLLAVRFIRRNLKPLLACLCLWLLFVGGLGYFLLSGRSAAVRAFYDTGTESAVTLREKIPGPVLDRDILLLNAAIDELGKKQDLDYVAIMDFEGMVIAHTDPAMINRTMELPAGCDLISEERSVRIEACLAQDPGGPIHFSTDIVYSSLTIGTVLFGVDAGKLDARLSAMVTKAITAFLFSLVAFAGALFLSDRHLRKKAGEKLASMEQASVIGPYVLKEKIATGGMAELFIAEQTREDGFRKKVALKRILSHLAENPDFIRMFIREARIAALLNHPNIVQIYDFRKVDGAYVIAMEYVDGKNLQELMAMVRKPLPIDLSVYLIQKICKGLHYSHTLKHEKSGEPMNIVHRDVSPQNMLLSRQGEVKISDFGISKATSEPSMTQAGIIKGKLSYIAPEQVTGQEVDCRADIYALGLIFYEILSGRRLFRFENDIEAIRTIPTALIAPIREVRPDVPEGLNAIVMRCLEKDRDERYQDAGKIDEDLQELKRSEGISYDESDLAEYLRKVLNPEEV